MADLLSLGALVVRVAVQLWNGQSLPDDAVNGTVDVIEGRLRGQRNRDPLEKLVDSLAEHMAHRITAAMESEYRDVPDNEREAAIIAAQQTLRHIALPDLIAVDLSVARLRQALSADGPHARRDLSDASSRLYDRIIAECCTLIIGLSNELPGFEVGVFGALLTELGDVQHSVDDLRTILDELVRAIPGAAAMEATVFEGEYRETVVRYLDRLEVLGLPMAGPRPYALTTAYVGLELDTADLLDRLRESNRPEDDAVDGARLLGVEDALSVTTRLFLRGEAGSGKTTVLRWIAVRCARGDLPLGLTEWNGLVPFYIKLRTWSGRRLPGPSDFLEDVGRFRAEQMPRGWVNSILNAGRAVVLVDGVDELPDSQRAAAQQWLGELLDTYPDNRFVVTSRPSAVKDRWLAAHGFDVARIEPMQMDSIRAFVQSWHAAYIQVNSDPADQEKAQHNCRQVLAHIVESRHLRQLAGTPLLAALLCLMQLWREHLPSSRKELYRIAIEVLMAQRESLREVAGVKAVMSAEDAVALLEDLAYWLVGNGESWIYRSALLRRLRPRLKARQLPPDPERALAHLLDWAGLIREPTAGRVDFVHRTFQEYLAAGAAVENDDYGRLVGHGHDDQWHQVVIMAVGRATRHNREAIITGLLDRAEAEPEVRASLNVLAIACLETAQEIDPAIRVRVEDVATRMLPPRTMSDADVLAGVGDLVLDLVRQHPITDARAAAATIRMASQVGGAAAVREMARCAIVRGREVKAELLSAWARADDPDGFAETVLTRSGLTDLQIVDPALTSGLRHLHPTRVEVRFVRGYGSLAFVQSLPTLVWLHVSRDPALRDLGGLSNHPRLKALSLGVTGEITIGPLSTVPKLDDLCLRAPLVSDLPSLAGLTLLKTLQLIGSIGSHAIGALLADNVPLARLTIAEADYLESLDTLGVPQLRRLSALIIRKAPRVRGLAGIEHLAGQLTELRLENLRLADPDELAPFTNLKSLSLLNSQVKSLAFLSGMTRLQSLLLGGVGLLPDLGLVRDLVTVNQLHLGGSDPVDLRPLAGRQGLTVYISGGQKRTVIGGDLLGPGSRVSIF